MPEYKIFLPKFSREVIANSLAFLEKKGITCEVSPKFNAGKKPPYETPIQVAISCPRLAKWPFEERKILTAFKLEVLPFKLRELEEGQKSGFSNLFGLLKKNDSALDINKLREDLDANVFSQLRACKREVRIAEDLDVFASTIFTPMFVVALTLGGDGLIYEGEFFDQKDVERDFWPDEAEVDEINEDLEDGEEPVFFDGW